MVTLAAARALLAERHMIAPGAPVVVAVSGGPDSLCLLHFLFTLAPELGATLHVVHLDHMIRGAESAADAAFVAELARAWGLPATVEAIDVAAQARAQGTNLQQAAREARYALLARVARAIGGQAVAVAHNADDQAETVVLHLLRGAGLEGLRGMRPVAQWEEWAAERALDREAGPRPALIRPLLTTPRAAIEAYLAEHRLDPRRDPSNLDRHYTRNRIRHELMPRLIEYNPRIVAALGRTASVCADAYDYLRAALAEIWPQLARERAGGFDFDGVAWRGLPPALQREALRYAHALLAGDETLGLEHVERARILIAQGVGGRTGLPGGVALEVGYGGSFTIGAPPPLHGPQLAIEAVALPVPGRVDLEGGWGVEAAYERSPSPPDAWEVELDADALPGPLMLRRRRAGDRLRPARGRGSRRVQDLFVDAKVQRALRAAWPLLVVGDSIVWVVGLRAAEGFVATPRSRRVVRVRVLQPDGEF